MQNLKLFSPEQLETMAEQFAKVDHITNEHWARIRLLIEDCDSRPALHQLSIANIKFLSGIVKHYLERGVLRRP